MDAPTLRERGQAAGNATRARRDDLRRDGRDAARREGVTSLRAHGLDAARRGARPDGAGRAKRPDVEASPVALVSGLLLALFMAALDSTIVATAMPAVATALGEGTGYTWPITAYLLTCTLSALLAGGLAARTGHRRLYLAGILVFCAASVGCALAPSLGALACWRAVEGIGGGILEAGVFIAVADLFEPRKRGVYLGAASAIYGLSSIAGPLLGGLIVQTLSWHWIFLVNLPAGAVALALVLRHLPARLGRHGRRFDIAGALTAAIAVTPATLAFALAGNAFALGSAPFLALLACSAVGGAALVAVERGRANAAIPVRILTRRTVGAGLTSGFCTQFALMAVVALLPRIAGDALGMADAAAGLMLVPMTLALMVGSNTAGALFRAHGRLRRNSCIGFALVATGALAIAYLGTHAGAIALELAVFVIGLGVGFGMPTANLAAQIGSDPADAGRATSLAMFFRGLGGTIASAVIGALSGVAGSEALGLAAAVGTAAILGLIASSRLPRLVGREG